MNIKEHIKKTYEFTTDEIKFIYKVAKELCGKYTLNEVLSTEWNVCFEYYVHMFSTLDKLGSRMLKQYEDYHEIRWLLNMLGDFYNKTTNEEDKAMAKAICDAIEGKE